MYFQTFSLLLGEQIAKGAIILGFSALLLFLSRRHSAASRHALLLCTFVTLALLPLTTLVPPQWNWSPRVPAAESFPAASGLRTTSSQTIHLQLPDDLTHSPSAPTQVQWAFILVSVWALGATFHLLRGIHACCLLRRLWHQSREVIDSRIQQVFHVLPKPSGRSAALRVSSACRIPMTWGIWRPVLLLPEDACAWADDRLHIVLRHELAHIRRRDAAARLLEQLVCALHWCNPLVWRAARQLRLAQEQACDDLVLLGGADPSSYAQELVLSVRRLQERMGEWNAAFAMAQPSTLDTRVRAILDQQRPRRSHSPAALLAGLSCAALLLLGSAVAQVSGNASKIADTAPRDNSDPDNSTLIEFSARFLEAPAGTAPGPLAEAFTRGATKGFGTLPPDQLLSTIKKLDLLRGIKLLAAPRLLVHAGESGTIEILNETLQVTTASGEKRTISPGLRCTFEGSLHRTPAGNSEIQFTWEATLIQLRPDATAPYDDHSFDTRELKRTSASVEPGGTIIFQIPPPGGKGPALWVMATATRPTTASLDAAKTQLSGGGELLKGAPESIAGRPSVDPVPAAAAPEVSPAGTLDDAPAAAAVNDHFGDWPIEINAESTNFDAGVAVASGAASLQRLDLLIEGDQIRYDPERRLVQALGNVTLTQPHGTVVAGELEYHFQTGRISTVGKTTTTIKDASPAAKKP